MPQERRTAPPRLRALLAVCLAGPFLPAPLAADPPRRLVLADLARLASVGDVQVSPEGAWVAYTVGRPDPERDRSQRDLWMVSWDGTRRVRLTWGPESASTPRWSPDGRFLAFRATRGDAAETRKGAQVWLLDRAGGEARRLTSLPGGVSDLAWSPDGTRMVLAVTDPDPDAEPEQKAGWKRKTAPPLVIDRHLFKNDSDGYLGNLRTHLRLLDLATEKVEALTSGPCSEENPAWSPDGRRLAFVSNRTPDPDRNDETAIHVIEARAGAEPRQLTSHPGPDGGRPSWSPDGKWIAFLRGDETRYTAYNLNQAAVVPAAGGPVRLLAPALDRRVYGPLLWSRDSARLTFLVQDDRTKYVGRVALAGGPVEHLTAGQRVVDDLAQRGPEAFALLAGSATEPREIWALEGGRLRSLSAHNAWLKEVDLGTVEDFSSRSADGTEVHGLLAKPPGFLPGRRVPTVLWIHGGPNGQDEHSFRFERAFLAARGYAVLAVNYRGGAGRGSAYQKAIFADWGNREVQDLLGAVDQAVRAGVADPERLGIGGWSYGGILTNYVIASDSRFRAAISGASSSLQLAMYGTDEYTLQYEAELGPPWKSQDLWIRLSYPFFHADRIRTPTLFLGGTKDFNVPVAGVEQMYQALRSLGVETRLVLYPDQHHELGPLSYQQDRLERYGDWLDRFLKK
jgi:dipeptidyl aminopeptidase/acylaminoacyl peptidase